MSEEETGKPKIIVDDDWKSRARAEKEQLQKQAEAKQRADAEPKEQPAAASHDEPSQPRSEPEVSLPLPPASFSFLVTSLATQALATMGQIPGEGGQPVLQLEHAKHFIDTLGILEEKTKGNLKADESAMLTNVLHQLRLLFVAVGQQPAPVTPEKVNATDI